MSERLTDKELADVTVRVADGRCAVCMNGETRVGCSACDGTGAFSLATNVMEGVLAEVYEWRNQRGTLCRGNMHALRGGYDDRCQCGLMRTRR